jgi:hypothetical protein
MTRILRLRAKNGAKFDLALVERVYGFRVVALIKNDAIYERILEMGAEWRDFIGLCKKLAKYYSDNNNREQGNLTGDCGWYLT